MYSTIYEEFRKYFFLRAAEGDVSSEERYIIILVLLVKRKKSTDHRFANAKILNQKFYTQSQISASTFFCLNFDNHKYWYFCAKTMFIH